MFKRVLKYLGLSILVFVGVLVIGGGVLFGSLAFMDAKSNEPIEEPKEEVVKAESLENVSHSEIRERVSSKRKQAYVDELDFMQTIHEMTHQKVEADQKWGLTPITEQQIDKMLRTLDREDYANEEFYREALTAWKNGDFSNAVEVHNTIWEWQDGTLGKATGLLTPEEEEEYLKENNIVLTEK
ncbi:DUF6241 domain-containing protein [Bacillus andreraoultii]|uniref:DUF6241 domain-containing protein n=1 Tax=Bacillus andreraoultii TaxID=1499685 RepID=UPI00067EC908|nr:DUF6241 domain-containing protein [Bacillus andreraoultii]